MSERILYLLMLLLLLNSCDKEGKEDTIPIISELLFSSGFEPNTSLGKSFEDYQVLEGNDSESGFSWPIKILGSNFSGIHRINDDGGSAIENHIDSIIGSDGKPTSALFQLVRYDKGVTQTPYQINNIKENPKELYISYWMKIDSTSLNGPHNWRALWEYKTKKYNTSSDNGFRMISFILTDDEGNPYWQLQGDKNPATPIWQEKNTSIPVPREEWFKVEYFLKWSKDAKGYISMKVNGNLIAEHYGATTSNGDDLDFIILTQVYGNTHPMHQWIDDIEIWNGNPNK